jgi:ribokinase
MKKPPRIVVVGSLNMDLVARVPRLPRPGETVHGSEFRQVPGGKGANQAVAAALLGAEVSLIGRVGDDAFGQQLIAALARRGVRTELVQVTPKCASGVALIGVEDSGQNAITVIGGANERLTPEDVHANEAAIRGADALLVQLEVPSETVAAAIAIAKEHGVLTILDPAPAPARDLPAELYGVDVLSPNQSEAEALTGVALSSLANEARAARILQERGAKQVVLKLGDRGAMAVERGQTPQRIAASKVEVVDTTAAGDAFTAALAVGLVEKMSLQEATQFACVAGSLATTRLGAQDAMPSREEVEALVHKPEARAKEDA